MKWSSVGKRLALIVVSTLLALVVAEVAYRSILNRAHRFSVAPTRDQFNFYQFDPVIGWANAPNVNGTYRRREFSYPIAINEHGMRQGPVSLARQPGKRRIAVMGDSFVWGIGVPDEERVTEQLQALLPDTEVLNFGVAGYAPLQHLLNLERVLQFQPDHVILLVCLGNDWSDNVMRWRYGYYKPYAVMEDEDRVRIRGYPVPNVNKFGFGRAGKRVFGSVLLGELHGRLLQATLRQGGLVGFTEELIYAADKDLSSGDRELRRRAIRINELLLAEIHRELQQHRVELLVGPAPSKRDYNRAGEYGHEGYYMEAEETLQSSCRAQGIPFLATVRTLHGTDFWVNDGHWTKDGHRKIAVAIAAHLTDDT